MEDPASDSPQNSSTNSASEEEPPSCRGSTNTAPDGEHVDPRVRMDVAYHLELASLLDDSERFRRAAGLICDAYGIHSLTVSVSIVDDETIHALNLEHLDHDWPTDVISFVFESESGVVDGEIIASRDTAARCAATAGWSVENELLLYVVHGLLHLAGLDDLDEPSAAAMRVAEQECLLSLGISAAADHISHWSRVSY